MRNPQARAVAASTAALPLRRIRLADVDRDRRASLLDCEWLATNGLGGYASGTIGGVPSRRYHGALVAALPPPFGRHVVVTDVTETLSSGATTARLTARLEEDAASSPLVEFRLEAGLPVWVYEANGIVIERRLMMPHGQNTTFVIYELLAGATAVELNVELAFHHRPHDAPVDVALPGGEPRFATVENGFEISMGDLAPIRIRADAQTALSRPAWLPQRRYTVEESRGYMHMASAWTPGHLVLVLRPGVPASVCISTESWDVLRALDGPAALAAEQARRALAIAAADPAAKDGLAAELVLAADQFIVTPVGRSVGAARVRAAGDEQRSVIAGYHWFTDWGRDTMISLEGLTLCTGRASEAREILRTFASSIRDGLLPNLFPEGDDHGLYHTADATLWFFHAIARYVVYTGDRALVETLLPQLVEVAERHLEGTRFGIAVDSADGLLRQGADGYQLTWMDAKVGDWVVTPRRGKAVEINALWYNALRWLERWLRETGRDADAQRYATAAQRTYDSFERRFWNESAGCLYDVVDGERGDDAACRPNQIFAIALDHPVLAKRRWPAVLEKVRTELLTPYGLRTLSPDHPDYQPRYHGDIRSRDAAYHQGTVWPWLMGAYADAWRKTFPSDTAYLAKLFSGFDSHLSEGCIGNISEIFDAEPPFAPRGCLAQAWSVAEVLRSLIVIARDHGSPARPKSPTLREV